IFLMPKTGETTRLMDRLIEVKGADGEAGKSLVNAATEGDDEVSGRIKKASTRNSVGYVIGTSLLFEALMLGWAASIFCRRDY
ncbi:MAG: hypothetical protein CFE26_26050, partial [Verrucomicrobiales bacterium VVV1]